MGIPFNPSIPKIVFVAPPAGFKTISDKEVNPVEIDFLARAMAMGKMHKVFPITGSIPAAIAAVIPGSVIHSIIGTSEAGTLWKKKVNIGHPSGVLDVEVEASETEKGIHAVQCTIGRTARKIMEGRVYISKKVYDR